MRRTLQNLIASIMFIIILTHAVKIEKGYVNLEVITGQESQKFKVDIATGLKQHLILTQSSKIHLQAKINFNDNDFQPQFCSFRLRHPIYQNVSEPVLASWDREMSTFQAIIDLGDPKHIKHLSGDYKLQIIISDDRLDHQIRKYIANAHVTFRHSLQKPEKSDLHYVQPSIIMTQAPTQRIDPPKAFTGFVAILIIVLFAVFLFGLNYQKVNISLFPNDGTGLILNLLFIGSLSLILYVLFQFWLNWTFIQTFQTLIVIILPVALTANYALIHVKKE